MANIKTITPVEFLLSSPEESSSSSPKNTRISSSNPKHSNVEIVLNRPDQTYRPNDLVEGFVVITAKDGWAHGEINLQVIGQVRLKTPPTTPKKTTSSSSSSKPPPSTLPKSSSSKHIIIPSPIPLMDNSVLIKPLGKLPQGIHRLPFSFPIIGTGGKPLYETYHGVYIDIDYTLKVAIDRGVFQRTLEDKSEFLLQLHPDEERIRRRQPQNFEITPWDISAEEGDHNPDYSIIPEFVIKGTWHDTNCPLESPFRGEIIVERCDVPIQSIDLQLARVERLSSHGTGIMIRSYSTNTHTTQDQEPLLLATPPSSSTQRHPPLPQSHKITERTEIQCLQIADGDVSRNVPIPVFMVFPRLFAAPTVVTVGFDVEYEIVLIVMLQDGNMVSQKYPIGVFRGGDRVEF